MSIRIASVLLSLLAHGTVFFYLGSSTPHDRANGAAARDLQVALVQAENHAPVAPESMLAAPAAPPAAPDVPPAAPDTTPAEPAQAAPEPRPESQPMEATSPATPPPVVSRVKPEPVKTPRTLLSSQSPGMPERPAKRLSEVAAKARQEPPPAHPQAPPQAPPQTPPQAPARKPVMPQPDPVVAPIAPRLASGAPVTGPQPHQASESSSPSEETLREIERAYMNALVAAIERHKRYPLRARKRGHEGEVQVRFTVLGDGTISRIEIGSSSLSAILDQAASRAVRELGRFEPIPSQLGRDHWEFQVPIRFVMR